MAYCPKCKFEWEASVLVCPDCHEILVDQLRTESAAAISPDESWVVVGGMTSRFESKAAKGSLDSNNIPSVVLPSSFAVHGRREMPMTSFVPSPSDGDLIMVPKEFQEEAMLVLKIVLGDDLGEPETDNI